MTKSSNSPNGDGAGYDRSGIEAAKRALGQLVEVMAALRNPETGCPWDIEQTFETIIAYTIEETYEVADAIERADMVDLEEELGDLLLQVVYHARMAEEAGHFNFADVAGGIVAKMVRRHPHVFGSEAERAAGPQRGSWARIKQAEKEDKARRKGGPGVDGGGGSNRAPSLLDDVPRALPALMRAIKLQDKAAKVGFDWPNLAPVMAKMREELAELEAELGGAGTTAGTKDGAARGDSAGKNNRAAIKEEFGDLLFVMANVARHLDIDPEAALSAANEKFRRRFRRMEEFMAEAGERAGALSLEELDTLWDRAKAEEKG